MSLKADHFHKALYIASWILFISLCVEAGGFLFNMIFTLFINPVAANKFWMEINLAALYNSDQSLFITVTSLMVIVAVLKAVMFYLIVKNFHQKKISLSRPFNEVVRGLILNLVYLALGIGLFSLWGTKVITGLVKQGIPMPDLQALRLDGAHVWLFMGVILIVVAQIFKKGIEIQSENELTI